MEPLLVRPSTFIRSSSSLLRPSSSCLRLPSSHTVRRSTPTNLHIRLLSSSRALLYPPPDSAQDAPSQNPPKPTSARNLLRRTSPTTTSSPTTTANNLDFLKSSLDFVPKSRPHKNPAAASSSPSSSPSTDFRDLLRQLEETSAESNNKDGSLASRMQSPIRRGGGDFLGGLGDDDDVFSNRNMSPLSASPLPLNSSTGRSIAVGSDGGVELGRAFGLLGMRVAQNNIRADVFNQRFHERPGLRRKRLRMERWRKKFKEDFQAIVRRVQVLKRQGW